MTDQTESDDYPICEDECVTWGGHAENCRVPAAIRALEAKVVEESLSAFEARADVARWMNACEAILKLWEGADLELRADRDRLAGEVEEWKARCAERNGAHGRQVAVLNDEVARLTAELAAARENEARYLYWRAQWLDESEPAQDLPYAYYTAKTPAELDAAIDAARRAGGEG